MVRSVLAAVLALLMLLPPGICVCGGGPRACPDHPVPGRALGHDGCDSSCRRHAPAEHAGAAAQAAAAADHHCPAPLPHHPTCPAVTAATPADTQAATDASTLLLLASLEEPLAWWLPVPPRATRTPAAPHVPSPPLFIAHCTLVI